MSSSPVEYSIAAPSLGRDPYRDRRPPYSEDAEQAVLAAMLMDADAVARVVELLDDGMFYREGHRRIFRAMITLSERGEIVDPLTLSNEIRTACGDLVRHRIPISWGPMLHDVADKNIFARQVDRRKDLRQ